MIITTNTQENIIDAFFTLATECPNKKITVKMIANKVGMTRENIYHNHFKGIPEIIDRARLIIDEKIYNNCLHFSQKPSSSILFFLQEAVIPHLYKRKEWLKALYKTNIDPNWSLFLESKYTPLIENFLNRTKKETCINNNELAQLFIKEFLAILSLWLSNQQPEPPSVFKQKFIYLLETTPFSLLTHD